MIFPVKPETPRGTKEVLAEFGGGLRKRFLSEKRRSRKGIILGRGPFQHETHPRILLPPIQRGSISFPTRCSRHDTTPTGSTHD